MLADDSGEDDDLIPESDKLKLTNDPDLVLRAAIEFERTGIIPRREDIENIDPIWERDVYTVTNYRDSVKKMVDENEPDDT